MRQDTLNQKQFNLILNADNVGEIEEVEKIKCFKPG